MSIEIDQNGVASVKSAGQPGTPVAGKRGRGGDGKMGKNIVALVVSFAALGISQFATLGLISRFAGVEQVGIWAYANAFRDPFLALMDFGTTRLLIAEIARRRDESDKLLGNGLTLGFIVGLPVLVVLMLAANLPGLKLSPLMIHAIYLKGLAGLMFTTTATFRSAFRAFNRMEYEAIISIIAAGLQVLGAFIVLYLGFPFIWLFAAAAMAPTFTVATSWWIYNRRIGRLRLRFELPVIRQLLAKTWDFTFVGLLSRAFMRVDVMILTFFAGVGSAGYYELATTLFYQLNTLAQLLTTAILPNMAQAYVKRPDRIGEQLDAAVRVQILAGLPLTAIGLFLSHQIVRFLYGPGYESSALLFQLLVMVVVLRFINQTLGVVLTAMDQQRKRVITLGLTVVFNVVANFLVIPVWGVMGATATSILSEIVLFGLTYFALTPGIRRSIKWRRLVRPSLATLVMSPPLYLIRDWPLALSLPLSTGLFLVLLFMFRSFSQEEVQGIAGAINRFRVIPRSIRRPLSRLVLKSAGVQAPIS